MGRPPHRILRLAVVVELEGEGRVSSVAGVEANLVHLVGEGQEVLPRSHLKG